jgi:hypothetical protein
MCIVENNRRRSLIESNESAMVQATKSMTSHGRIVSSGNPVHSKALGNKTVGLAEAIRAQQKHCVQHNYHDHAFDQDEASYVAKSPMVSKGGVTIPFPMKLHDMLDHIELMEPELAAVISWQPHGRCFLVRKPKQFSDGVLARFFSQKKYASFQRQLNLYGFNRITKGPDRGSYYHELFLRGKKFLCRGIGRMKIKGTGARMASNPDAEPDFYTMAPMGSPCVETSDAILSTTSPAAHPASAMLAVQQVMPPLNISSNFAFDQQTRLTNGNGEELDFVFDNMPFHTIDRSQESRRHSLLDLSRRNSFAREMNQRNLMITPNSSDSEPSQPQPDDDIFFAEMDLISSLGSSAISDAEMGHILDRIIQ